MPAGPPILCAETLRATRPAPAAASVARRSAAEVDRQLAVGGDRVDVQRHAGAGGEPRDLLDGLDRADLVVGPEHRDEGDGCRVAGELGLERVEAQPADLVERQLHDDGALVRGEPLDRVDRGVVLAGGDEDAARPDPPSTLPAPSPAAATRAP